MSTIQQTDYKPDATISFRCDPEWKKVVNKAAIDRGQSMQEICIAAISKYLKIELPRAEDAA